MYMPKKKVQQKRIHLTSYITQTNHSFTVMQMQLLNLKIYWEDKHNRPLSSVLQISTNTKYNANTILHCKYIQWNL
jgi:hypothetical protein